MEQFSKLEATLTRIQEQRRRAAARAASSNDMRREAAMNPPVLLAAMLAALSAACPAVTIAQESAAQDAPHRPACPARAEARGALGALPARAGTVPEPQRGTVAPSARVSSHTATPSSRAMAAALARDEKTTIDEKTAATLCKRAIAPDAKEDGEAQAEDG
jgi:hypothetical protein